jgi:hypothetical protein
MGKMNRATQILQAGDEAPEGIPRDLTFDPWHRIAAPGSSQ